MSAPKVTARGITYPPPAKRRKRQFTGTSKPRQFYNRKVRRVGRDKRGAYIALGRIIPKDWAYVRVWKPVIEGRTMFLKIDCIFTTEEM